MKPVSAPINGLTQMPGALESTRAPLAKDGGLVGNTGFREQLEALKNTRPSTSLTPPGLNKVSGLKFSNHAIERMMSRGIRFTPQDMDRLNEAVARAQAKGSKDSLILMNDSALIVSVKNKTVVTVMDKAALKENVFTNIDSTIVM